MLIVAIILAGGILLIDVFYLKPSVLKQENAALQEQSVKAENVGRFIIRDAQDNLLRACRVLAETEEIGAFFAHSQTVQTFALGVQDILAPADAQIAWLSDVSGGIVAYWSSKVIQNTAGESLVDRQDASWSIKTIRDAPAERGLMRLAGHTALFARHVLGQRRTGLDTEKQLWVVRLLDTEILRKIAQAIGGSVVFVQAEDLPKGLVRDGSTSQGFWSTERGQITVAWQLKNAAGAPLGYVRADIPVMHINHQAVLARRIVLIILSLSMGLVFLVIVGINILITAPIMRLLKRLGNLEQGRTNTKDLTNNLHGEPLVLARRLEWAFDRMDSISRTDQLTGLANRRHFEEVLNRFYEQAKRYGRPLSLIVMDLDHFKTINDTWGHPTGDEMLKVMGNCIESACRKADLPARIGGDEFAVLLPETPSIEAEVVAERIRETIASKVITVKSTQMNVTISLGLTDLNAGEIDSGHAMISLADKALYVAKDQGRNRLVQAHDLLGPKGELELSEETGKVKVLHNKLAGLDSRFKDVFLSAVEEIMQILEHRDQYIAIHAQKVRHYAVLIGREMELPDRMLKRIAAAAILHDIGMTAIPDSILLNPGPLKGEQLETVRRHVLLSVRIMEGLEFMELEIPAVRYHHERFDGKGYPEGLMGPAIPLSARILAVADAFDAMISPRVFREAKSFNEAIRELRGGAGTQFDPAVAEAFIAVALRMGEQIVKCHEEEEVDLIEADSKNQVEAVHAPADS